MLGKGNRDGWLSYGRVVIEATTRVRWTAVCGVEAARAARSKQGLRVCGGGG